METLQKKIQLDLKNAMLNKQDETRDLLRVVIGEMNREGKELPDARVMAIIKKMIENAKLVNKPNEIVILEKYLPSQLDEATLKQEIVKIISEKAYTNIKEMGKVMADLKTKYAGQYDGQVASKLVKEIFA